MCVCLVMCTIACLIEVFYFINCVCMCVSGCMDDCLFEKGFLFYFINCACVCVSKYDVCVAGRGTCREQKMILDLPKLVLQAAVSHRMWVLGTEVESSARNTKPSLSHWLLCERRSCYVV